MGVDGYCLAGSLHPVSGAFCFTFSEKRFCCFVVGHGDSLVNSFIPTMLIRLMMYQNQHQRHITRHPITPVSRLSSTQSSQLSLHYCSPHPTSAMKSSHSFTTPVRCHSLQQPSCSHSQMKPAALSIPSPLTSFCFSAAGSWSLTPALQQGSLSSGSLQEKAVFPPLTSLKWGERGPGEAK